MLKNDKYYRDKLVDDIEFIIQNMKQQTQKTLEGNPVLLDSMMFRLIQISENAKNLSEQFKERHFNIPWTAIYGLRNRIVHDYGNVDLKIIFDTLSVDIVELKKMFEEEQI